MSTYAHRWRSFWLYIIAWNGDGRGHKWARLRAYIAHSNNFLLRFDEHFGYLAPRAQCKISCRLAA
eukprot:1868772-Amphidinium_carterae.1